MKDEKYLEEKLGLPPDQVKYVMEHPCLYEEGVPRNKGEKRKGDVGSAPGKIEDDSPGRRGG